MGVKGLWKLVAPAGHQINIETLHGRTLAVDVSIWIVQFLEAMRGNDGKPVKNCHLLGTLKRVARLLYHNIRPVFVFDGAAPALKLQTIQARRQRRRDADLNVEQSARRILAARMHRLISSSNTTTTTNAAQQENRDGDEGTCEEKGSENETTTSDCNYYQKRTSSSQVVQHVNGVVSFENLEDDDGSRVDTSSMAGNNRTTQQDNDDEIQWQPGDTNEMEEEEEESMMDDDDDILLPEDDGVDISVIAALPIHMRKKVIEKAQRNERMRSRRVYMPLAADPQRFCDAQIQNLIRGSDLNRQIRNLQEKNDTKIISDIKETERSIASDETRKFFVTTESSNVEGSTQVPPVEDRLGTYEGFEQWMYQSSDEEEDIKYGEDRMDKQESSSSTMKIRQEKKSTIIKRGSTDINKGQENINNKKRTRRYDDGAGGGGGFLPNMSDAALDGTIERRAAVLKEDKHMNTNYDGGFIVDSSIKPDVVVTTKNMKKVSSSSIYKMGSSEEEGGGGMNVVMVLGGNEHDDVVVQQHSSSSSNVITPPRTTKVNEVKSQERQQDAQNHPSQCDDTGFELDNHKSSLSYAAAAGSSTKKTTIGFSSTLQQQEEEDHRATTATLEQQQQQQGRTRAENNSPKIDVAASCNQDEEETHIHDIELEVHPENISNFSSSSFEYLVDTDAHSPSFQQQPVLLAADEGGYAEVDKVIEQSSQILGNMPDYVKRQFERHVKEYRNKMLAPPLSSSMDEEQREKSDKIHGSSSGGGGIILEEDEWEDGIKNQEMGSDDNDLSTITKGSTKEDHVGSSSFNSIKYGGGSTAPLTIVSSQCKSEEGGGSFKIGNNMLPLPLTSSRRMSSSNCNNSESLVDEKPEGSFGGIETTMMTQALNVKENSTNNNLVVVNTTYQQQHHRETQDSEVEESSQNLELDFETKLNAEGGDGGGDLFVYTTKCKEEQQQMDETGKYPLDSRMKEIIQENEEQDASKAHNKAMRDAATVTDEMKEEVMGLLELLGVPYMVAPMEAEAQCAELERLNLVVGTITDDSDTFVFGSHNVYKNIFQDGKNVEAYNLSDITREVGIGTEEMQCLAMLLGSDYTEGINGVGPVNAMEIVEAFSVKDRGVMQGLINFRDWLEAVVDPVEQKRLAQLTANIDVTSLSSVERFSVKHRNARLRWVVKPTFPEKDIIKAYQHPRVNSSMKKFTWHFPDEAGLHKFCSQFLGWDHQESTKLIDPIMKKLKEGGGMRQRRLDDYFVTYGDDERFARFRSKRLRAAVKGVVGKGVVTSCREPDPV